MASMTTPRAAAVGALAVARRGSFGFGRAGAPAPTQGAARYSLRSPRSAGVRAAATGDAPGMKTSTPPDGMTQVLFVECGFGCDQHGQNMTKAAVRACRNAIEFNSIPSINAIVPGGYESMKLRLVLGCPRDASELDLEAVKAVFPYGTMLPIEVKQGGLETSCGIALERMGDTSDDLIIVCAAVTVGY